MAESGQPTYDGFEFVETVGYGAYGYVNQYRELATGKRVAVKQFREHYFNEPQRDRAREFFKDGVKIMAALAGDAGIVDVIQPYNPLTQSFMMEYVEGGSLEKWFLERPDDFSLKTCIDVFRQLCQIVARCHNERQFVHRDLKPQNVLVVSRDPVRLKLCDFDLSHMPGVLSHTRTVDAGMRATPNYLPYEDRQPGPDTTEPRQDDLDNSTRATLKRRDVFALSAILYWMITKLHPQGPTDDLEEVQRCMARRAGELGRVEHANLLWIVERGISKADRSIRFRSCDDVLDALDNLSRVRPPVVDAISAYGTGHNRWMIPVWSVAVLGGIGFRIHLANTTATGPVPVNPIAIPGYLLCLLLLSLWVWTMFGRPDAPATPLPRIAAWAHRSVRLLRLYRWWVYVPSVVVPWLLAVGLVVARNVELRFDPWIYRLVGLETHPPQQQGTSPSGTPQVATRTPTEVRGTTSEQGHETVVAPTTTPDLPIVKDDLGAPIADERAVSAQTLERRHGNGWPQHVEPQVRTSYIDVLVKSGRPVNGLDFSGAVTQKWRPSYHAPDLSGIILDGSQLRFAHVRNANWGNASLRNTKLHYADLRGGRFDRADLSGSNTNLYHAGLGKSDERTSSFLLADLSNAILTEADFDGANVQNANFLNARVRGADFRGAINLKVPQICRMIGWEKAMLPGDVWEKEGKTWKRTKPGDTRLRANRTCGD